MLEVALAGVPDGGCGVRPARKKDRISAERRTPFPQQVGLQLARLVAQAPEGVGWLHEVKYDGYRVLIWRNGKAVRITSRGDQDWSARLPGVGVAVRQLPCRTCILDGELVALDAQGRSDFGRLQRGFADVVESKRLRVMVFDVLYEDGVDVRDLPQLERKTRLAHLLEKCAAPLELTAYALGKGAAAARAACEAGLEGIVCKATDAPYREGRPGTWVKVKCVDSDEYAIVGYTEGQGARARLGSLLLGSPAAANAWRYRGRVGTGLDESTIANLLRRLESTGKPVRLENPPTRIQLRGAQPIWTEPKLVVEVEFRGETADGLLRQASLKGIRADRSVASLRKRRRDSARVESHLDQPRGG
jgi:bifunctional non-homologous end joining protein LigD